MHLKEFADLREIHTSPLSRVYRGRHIRSGRLVSLKRYGKRDTIRRGMLGQVKNERDALVRVGKHPNVAELYGAFETAEDFWIVMEWCGERNLGEIVGKGVIGGEIEMNMVRKSVLGILRALERCHTVGVLHMDLRLANMMIRERDTRVKVVDFGACALMREGKKGNVRLEGPQMGRGMEAPESLEGVAGVSFATDLWSMGCAVFKMVSGKDMFVGQTEWIKMKNICRGNVEWPESFPRDARSFIEALTKVEPSDRLGFVTSNGRIDYSAIRRHKFLNFVPLE